MTDAMDITTENDGTQAEAKERAHGAAREGNCLLLTLNTRRLLVPRNIVAEVVRHSFLRFSQDPDSGLGYFEWRGRRVPHLKCEVLGEESEPEVDDDTRVAIFHGLRNRELLPFYGFTISGSPRLLRVSEDDLMHINVAELHPAELMRVGVDQEEAYIPKVDHFENGLIEQLKPHTDGKRK